MQRIGSRAQVMHGTAKMTGGGLRKKDLKYNKQGKIVSKKMSAMAKKEKRLQKAGYTTRKGQFGAVRNMKGGLASTPIAAVVGEGKKFIVDNHNILPEIGHKFANMKKWDKDNSYKCYKSKIKDNIIMRGCPSGGKWAMGKYQFSPKGEYNNIEYTVDDFAPKLENEKELKFGDFLVGVASHNSNVKLHMYKSTVPKGCYFWRSFNNGNGSSLYANGIEIMNNIQIESSLRSRINVIVNFSNSTVKFMLNGLYVGEVTIDPNDINDLRPAASVVGIYSKLRMSAVN